LYFITDFANEQKEESKPPELPKWKKKLSQTLRAYNSQMHWTILLKFDMWGPEGGERLHYENNLSSTREHRATCA